MPESLLESELFGIEGRRRDRRHRPGAASSSSPTAAPSSSTRSATWPPALQVKLLRALQEREIVRVGGERPIPVDVRLVAATHRSLEELVADGTFREDLYYRIKGVELELPPLRERREEIPLLVRHFVEQFCQREGIPVPPISRDALALLLDYDYPGNVRELQNLIARRGLAWPRERSKRGSCVRCSAAKAAPPDPKRSTWRAVERRHIERVLKLAQRQQERGREAPRRSTAGPCMRKGF